MLLVFAAGLAACDSGDPVDGPDPREVAGTYRFTEFTFDPNASAIPDVNVLDTLVATTTQLRLFEDGSFALEYQFRGGVQSLASGSFRVRSDRIDLTADADDQAKMQSLLLDREVRLNRVANDRRLLEADISKTANLEAFSPGRYEGLTSVPGTLRLRLSLR